MAAGKDVSVFDVSDVLERFGAFLVRLQTFSNVFDRFWTWRGALRNGVGISEILS